jgi:hypothetical protein
MCNCTRVQYQLRREKPLAAKYCHCRACQVLHGELWLINRLSQKKKIDVLSQPLHFSGVPFTTRQTFGLHEVSTR